MDKLQAHRRPDQKIMKVFKFGGASIKDAAAVRNVAGILKKFPSDKLVVVVSAMGKTTNNLERLVEALFYKKEESHKVLEEVRAYHLDIISELFPDKNNEVYTLVHNSFVELEWALEGDPEYGYDQEYDQIVGMGEIIATQIVSGYLSSAGLKNAWMDVRDLVKTDDTYREGKVNWEETDSCVNKYLKPKLEQENIIVLQGFLGGTSENFTTTLGREGSDYTAAILAYCLDASEVTIWKDVPGVLNADPKWFDQTELINELTYQDAIELSYYGATVIHPKTLKPLQNKDIPLFVRSFIDPGLPGTRIQMEQTPLPVPCFIFKVDQVLLSISPKDFSFIMEDNLSHIFEVFHRRGVKINTMQNSALSFSVCIDNEERKLPGLIKELQENYRVLYNEKLELVTIRYYDQATIGRVTLGKQILLEVKSRNTVQMVIRDSEKS
jgi:aspartate kinase